MKTPGLLLIVLSAAVSFSACSTVKYTDLAKPTEAKTSLTEGYSILSYLMKDESNLDKVLWIKDASPDVEAVIKDISQTSRETRDQLEALAGNKPSISLTKKSLPPVEAETRDAIAKSTAKQLLGNSGKSFELRILLTQVQAMNYASHLCQVLASTDPNRERSSYLSKQGEKFLSLRERVVKQVGGL